MSSSLEIDGSQGEGGGQVLRIALCLSALYKIPVKINNIRAGRQKPGLAAQHLKGVELLRDMCNAKVNGAYIGSTALEFNPGQLNADGKHTFFVDIGTAGCICLLAQVALPCALFFPQHVEEVRLILKGGTNVPMGPHIEYLTEVLRPLLNKFGADFDFSVIRRGYYPAGGGEVHLYIKPVHALKAVTLTDPGMPCEIVGWAYVAGAVPIREACKIAMDAKSVLRDGLSKYNITPLPNINIEAYKEDCAVGHGSGINLVCTTTSKCTFGGSGLGSKRQLEVVPGIQAANEILDTILCKSCVDEHAQDQLIIFMALAKGVSKVNLGSTKLTNHTETAIQIAEMMLNQYNLHFKLSENENNRESISHSLECEGCGYENKTFR